MTVAVTYWHIWILQDHKHLKSGWQNWDLQTHLMFLVDFHELVFTWYWFLRFLILVVSIWFSIYIWSLKYKPDNSYKLYKLISTIRVDNQNRSSLKTIKKRGKRSFIKHLVFSVHKKETKKSNTTVVESNNFNKRVKGIIPIEMLWANPRPISVYSLVFVIFLCI